ncbi:MGMT family protein [Candidatus Bipolaricaulota bacterium]|nr:MGMT family protein [Candidatus Bipolaricaulota bacterium]
MSLRKSWREKLADDKGLPRVERIDDRMRKTWGEGTFVIPAPREVDALMRDVPCGKLTTITCIRAALATHHGTTIACPLTTGIFAGIAAKAAAEAEEDEEVSITPYWRTLKSTGEINPKYPGGGQGQAKRLEEEGHAIIQKGTRFFVENYEEDLFCEFEPK